MGLLVFRIILCDPFFLHALEFLLRNYQYTVSTKVVAKFIFRKSSAQFTWNSSLACC